MNLLFIDDLLKSDMPGIMINVFLHSIWQGAALSVLAWLCLKSTKIWSGQARYNLLVFFLFAFVACIVFTFYNQLTGTRNVLANYTSNARLADSSLSEDPRMFQLIMQWFHSNAGWIFLTWCLIFLFKANQMVRNLVAIEGLKQFGTLGVSPQWKLRFDELRTSLGIKIKVVLAESTIISQPLVVGTLKPLVLVPIGFLNGLSPKEVEAILLHELAHVRRNDYLVNLLQGLMETIFFFNPFVYWLSALVRNEREHCCDAIAIQHSGSKKIFVDALLSVQQRVQSPPYALGLLGMKSQLAQRVDRIITQKNKTFTTMEKLIVSGSYLLLFVTLASFSLFNNKTVRSEQVIPVRSALQQKPDSAPQIQAGETKTGKSIEIDKTDTIPKNASKDFIAGYNAGKNYKMGTSRTAGDTVKIKIEQNAARRRVTEIQQADPAYPITVSITEANEKKRIEKAMVASKKADQ